MDAVGDPVASSFHRQRVVQVESNDGCSSASGHSEHMRAVFVPAKMFSPPVAPRMKKPGQFSGLRIVGKLLLTFELVAEGTAQAKVFEFCFSTHRARCDVINMKTRHRHFLRRLAVFAPIVSRANDLFAKFFGQARHGEKSGKLAGRLIGATRESQQIMRAGFFNQVFTVFGGQFFKLLFFVGLQFALGVGRQ